MLQHIQSGLFKSFGCLLLGLALAAASASRPPATAVAPRPDPAAEQPHAPAVFDCAAVTEISQSECQALVALYNSTAGPHWRTNTGWLQTSTPCNWYGVTCAAQHVDALALPKNNLAGAIPEELGNLTQVVTLTLKYNALTGLIPPALGQLQHLESLDLEDNYYLRGSIPSELGNLANLSYLNLRENNLSGPIPVELGNLTNLAHLNLARNYLSGAIPPALGNLTQLRYLYLGSAELSGPIPPELGNLIQLRELYLSHTRLSGSIPPELGKLTELRLLGLSNTLLSGAIPPELGHLTQLQSLSLNDNFLSGPILPQLGHLPLLAGLSLEHNFLSGPIPPELGNLTKLCDLDLSDNQLSGPIPPELGRLSNIGACLRPGASTGAGQAGLARSPSVPESAPAGAPDYPHPEYGFLDLGGNRLSGAIPVELGQLCAATGVELGCNQLTGTLPPAVGAIIRWGSVDWNLLTGYDPAVFPNWNWHMRQTTPPTALRAVADGGTVILTWQPAPIVESRSFYEISYATAPEGPYTVYGWTADETVSSYTIDPYLLREDIPYYFRLRTFTAAHYDNTTACRQHTALISDYSAVASTGGAEPPSTPTATLTATPAPTPTGTPTPYRVWLPLLVQ